MKIFALVGVVALMGLVGCEEKAATPPPAPKVTTPAPSDAPTPPPAPAAPANPAPTGS
jgi:hypothetical protein